MLVELFVPQAGTLSVKVGDDLVLLCLQDLIGRTAIVEFPVPLVIEADEPPLTGLITVPVI